MLLLYLLLGALAPVLCLLILWRWIKRHNPYI